MADGSDQEKTEAPTAKRREDAFLEGKVPRSPELNAAAMFLTAALVVNSIGPGVGTQLIALFGATLAQMGDGARDPARAIELLRTTGYATMKIVALLTAGFAVSVLAVAGLQGRGLLSLQPLTPKFERLNPLSNVKRLFSSQPVVDLVKSLAKMGIVAWAMSGVLTQSWGNVSDLGNRDLMAMFPVVQDLTVHLLKNAGLAYLALASLDYAYQLWQHEKNLKMSKEDVRQENKQQEGDPMLRHRMRSLARARIRRQMFEDVKTADVVIVNPTHIAVALRYDPVQAPAPVVLAMGQRKIAERIKALAFEHKVPVIENKPLARALLASAHVGQMIPAELYAAVAEVLAFVIRQRALASMRWKGSARA
jgi:flagellar biosynthetic protein FlhB